MDPTRLPRRHRVSRVSKGERTARDHTPYGRSRSAPLNRRHARSTAMPAAMSAAAAAMFAAAGSVLAAAGTVFAAAAAFAAPPRAARDVPGV